MAYYYSARVFAGSWPRPSWRAGVLLGSTGLVLAATLLLPRAGSPAPAAPAHPLTAFPTALPPGVSSQLASLPTATWLPYPASASSFYQLGTSSEAVAVVYRPAGLYAPATASTASAMQRSWDTIKQMFR